MNTILVSTTSPRRQSPKGDLQKTSSLDLRAEQAVLIEEPHHAGAPRGRGQARKPYGETSGSRVRGGWGERQIVSRILKKERMRGFVRRKVV